MLSFDAPNYNFNLPWFIFDIINFQLITSPIIPGDISDTKDIILSETPIPGLNYSPIQYTGGGNRKISFTLPLIKRNNTVGNVLLVKQFEQLRNQSAGLLDVFTGQFTPNPKVLYYWGTGSVPLIYFVSKCNFTHKAGWTNQLGNPQYTDLEIELVLDESNPLYKAEELFRKISAVSGSIVNNYNTVKTKRSERAF